jgi:hypothetical protein
MTIDEAVASVAEIIDEIAQAAMVDGKIRLRAAGCSRAEIKRFLARERAQMRRHRAEVLAELRAELTAPPKAVLH